MIENLKKYWLDAVLIILISGFFCLYGLGQNSFGDGDQTIHAKVTQEMVHSGNWWTPTRRGKPYYSKPPFQMWLSAAVVSILGESNANYRLVSALCGVSTYLFTFFFALYLFKDRRAAWLSFMLLLGSRRVMFAHGFREAVQDGMLYFLITLSMYFFWVVFEETEKQFSRNSKRIYLFSALGGITVGLAILTKHAAGLLPMAIIGVFLLATKRLIPILKYHLKSLLLAFSLSLIIPACFFIPHMIKSWAVFNVMLYHEIYKRATVGYHYRHNTWLYLHEIFANRGTVPPEILTAGLLWGAYLWYKRQDIKMAFLICWSVVPVAIFTPMNSRLMWYISPAIPGMAILSGITLSFLLKHSLDRFNEFKFCSRLEQSKIIFIFGFSVLVIFSSVKSSSGILHTILNSEKRLLADRMTTEILATSEEKLPKIAASYNAPTLTRYEEFYWARLGLDQNKEVDLARIISDQNIKYVLTSPEAAVEIIKKRPISGYLTTRPRLNRERWLAILTFVPKEQLLAEFKKAETTFDTKDKDFFINISENKIKIKLEDDYILRTLGATITFPLGVSNEIKDIIIKFNNNKINDYKIEDNKIVIKLTPELWNKDHNNLELISNNFPLKEINSAQVYLNQ